MVKIIRIFNPKEFPFGPLSIDNNDMLSIYGKKYNTIRKYIYSNMLKTPLYKILIQSPKIRSVKEINDEYDRLRRTEIIDSLKKAIEKGIDAKINKNKELETVLLETKEAPIYYICEYDTLLGVGENMNGLNIVGKQLQQKRREIVLNFKEKTTLLKQQQQEDALYEAYIAYTILEKEITNGKNLSEYIGDSPTNVIDKFGRVEAMKMKQIPDKKFVVDSAAKNLIKKEIIDAVNNPQSLVYSVRKNNIRRLRDIQIIKREKLVLDMYLEYLIEKEDKYKNLPKDKYKEAIKQQYEIYGDNTRIDAAVRTYKCYEKGFLSDRLSGYIDTALEDAGLKNIISDQEIIESESYSFENTITDSVNDFSYDKSYGDPVKIYDEIDKNEVIYIPFSLLDNSEILNIEDNVYPTIFHYLYTILFSILPGYNIKKAYNEIIFNDKAPLDQGRFKSPTVIVREYISILRKTEEEQMKISAKIALDIKIEDRQIQDVLLSTENDIILFNDFSNPILGVGKMNQKYENFVGSYLMKLRQEIKDVRSKETINLLKDTDVSELLEKDIILNQWIHMRVIDTCKTIISVKNYVYQKTKENVDLTEDFVESVLDKIYHPCSHIFSSSTKITANVPRWFVDIVDKCPGFSKSDVSISNVIWKRLAVMIWYLIDVLKTNNNNIRLVLLKIENLASEEKTCNELDNYTRIENCILSAIINIIKGLILFNNKSSFEVDKVDVDTAVSIILNKEIKTVPETNKQTEKHLEETEEYDFPEEEHDENELQQHDDEYDENAENPYENDAENIGYDENDTGYYDEVPNGYSPKRSFTLKNLILDKIPETKDNIEEIEHYIINGMKTIESYKMPNVIKRNRINFFSNQR
jgi:predicted NAD-dependent protein-ADP-ribosyltransferase YbiA (DUF1768 family)